MDGQDLKHAKHWKCPNGHVLGVIERVEALARLNGQRISYETSKLIIFRKAINLEDETLADVDVAGTLHGRMLLGFDWRCSVCGCLKDWHPDEEALGWLKAYMDKRRR